MTVGPAVAAAGLLLLSGVGPGTRYLTGLVPGLALFGVGLATLVAPLTAAVLGAVPDERDRGGLGGKQRDGEAGGIARHGGLAARRGPGRAEGAPGSRAGRRSGAALRISAGLCLAGAAVAFFTVRASASVVPVTHPSPTLGCSQRGVARGLRPRCRRRSRG